MRSLSIHTWLPVMTWLTGSWRLASSFSCEPRSSVAGQAGEQLELSVARLHLRVLGVVDIRPQIAVLGTVPGHG